MADGNGGSPQYGVCRYHAELRNDVKYTRDRVDQIYIGLFGDPKKTDDEGLRGRVNRHERILRVISRCIWGILGVAGTAIGVALWR